MLKQLAAVTSMNVKGIPQRLASSCVIVIGLMCVVGVLVSVLAMSTSLTGVALAGGHADRAIVLSGGASSEGGSSLSAAEAATIADAPGVARGLDGKPAATADFVVPVNFARRSDGTLAGLRVRGVSALWVRPEITLVEGRPFTPGRREVIVGRNAQTVFEGLEIGDRVALRDSEWTVVGAYVSGDAAESGLIVDAATLLSAYQRALVSSVTVRLASADSFEQLESALAADPTLSVDVFREPEYFAEQTQGLSAFLFFVTYVVSGIMAAGALVGAVNTMYSAVSARNAEIATLRALGFGGLSVAASVLAEALLLALLGAASGAAIAWLVFSGDTINIGGGSASLVTQLRITPATLGMAVLWAAAVGLFGGLLPALRAARLPVAVALRAV